MKTYKIRSLIYLGCFVASAIVYYNFEQERSFNGGNVTIEMADTQYGDTAHEENPTITEELQDVQ